MGEDGSEREVEEEGGALAEGALDGDSAFVALDDLAHDEEAKACALPRLLRREERVVDLA